MTCFGTPLGQIWGGKNENSKKKNQTQLKVAANTGTKSFAQVRYEWLELDKLEQRERLNGRELTVDVLNELFAEHFRPETRNAVRGYGLGVEWNDVPGIQINRRGVGREVASLRIELEASRTMIEKLQDETAEKDEEMQVVKAQLNGIDARLHTPLEGILIGGVDGINKLIATLTQLAGEKQVEAISHGMHAVANSDEVYTPLLSN